MVFRTSMDSGGPVAAEVVAVPLAPFAVTLGKCDRTHVPNTVYMPERRGKVHPFLRPVLPDGATEQGVHAGIGLVQKRDEIVLHHRLRLGIQIALPVQRCSHSP